MFWAGVIVGWTISSILCALVLSGGKSLGRHGGKQTWNVW